MSNNKQLKLMLRSLHSTNFRLFFLGQGLSLIGTWMSQVATIWLVYLLTNSALLLGAIAFISEIPIFFISPFAGVFIDRFDRHRLLIITQTLAAIRSFLLAVLTLTGLVNIWHLAFLSAIQGLIAAVDLPTRQAFVPEMVDNEEDLSNAIALSSSLGSGARLVGPAIAGAIVATAGVSWCFFLDSLSYLAIISALIAMKLSPRQKEERTDREAWQELKAGFAYSFNSFPIRSILLLLALVYFMGTPFIALGPILAKEILQGDSDTFGFLMTASGIGALIGAIYLSSRQSLFGLEKLIALAPALLGLGLIGLASSRFLWLSLLIILLIGFFLIVQNAASNTILQTILEDDKRGRVMSLYIVASESMVPLGNLFAGILASKIGTPKTLLVEGIFCLLGSIIFVRYLDYFKHLLLLAQND